MSLHPTTPPNEHARGLWPSPQFSDYFSGSEDQATNGERKIHNPIQSRILSRLSEIARKIDLADYGAQTPNLLDFDAELSALEARLNAPESQTREIAEETGSLFADDDEEGEAAVLLQENDELRLQVRRSESVIERVTRLKDSLVQRCEEMKKWNQIASEEVQAASDKIAHLQEDNLSLHKQNALLHADLLTAIPTISRLKSQMVAIQSHLPSFVNTSARDTISEEISRWQHEWADVERDFEDIRRRYMKRGQRNDSAIGEDDTTLSGSEDEEADSMEKVHRSRIIIRRGGLIRRIDVDVPSSDEEDAPVEKADEDKSASIEEPRQAESQHTAEEKGDERKSSSIEKPTEEGDSTALDDICNGDDTKLMDFNANDEDAEAADKTEKEEEEDDPPSTHPKTPWQELWHSLAEYAGMHNYDEED